MSKLYPDYLHSKDVHPTFYIRDISQYTSDEVYALIFYGVDDKTSVPMPEWIAEQVVKCDHFDERLRDWAWSVFI